MNKTFAIIGSILFIAAVAVGYFAGFENAFAVEIALGAFGFAALVTGAVKTAKEKDIATWKTVVIIIGATAGGILCYVGGLADSIFQQISGLVVALLAVIGGLLFSAKKAEN